MEKGPIKLENVLVLPRKFRNFSGSPTKFNKAGGKRQFCVKLPTDVAEALEREGFTIHKKQNPVDPQDVSYILSIIVSFRVAPPNITMICGNQGTRIVEENVGILDQAEITYADIVISPYAWEVNGRTGYSAYLREMWVTIAENAFADKYSGIVIS